MALLHAHRGPISGLMHVHLVRESATVRAARMAGQQATTSDTSRAFASELPFDGRFEVEGPVEISRGELPADNL